MAGSPEHSGERIPDQADRQKASESPFRSLALMLLPQTNADLNFGVVKYAMGAPFENPALIMSLTPDEKVITWDATLDFPQAHKAFFEELPSRIDADTVSEDELRQKTTVNLQIMTQREFGTGLDLEDFALGDPRQYQMYQDRLQRPELIDAIRYRVSGTQSHRLGMTIQRIHDGAPRVSLHLNNEQPWTEGLTDWMVEHHARVGGHENTVDRAALTRQLQLTRPTREQSEEADRKSGQRIAAYEEEDRMRNLRDNAQEEAAYRLRERLERMATIIDPENADETADMLQDKLNEIIKETLAENNGNAAENPTE